MVLQSGQARRIQGVIQMRYWYLLPFFTYSVSHISQGEYRRVV